jgi:hypothetical protein
MRNRKCDMPTIKVKNIQSYIDSYKERENNYAVIQPDGNYFYLVNGNVVNGLEFESEMPYPELQKNAVFKGQNLDGRSNWID